MTAEAEAVASPPRMVWGMLEPARFSLAVGLWIAGSPLMRGAPRGDGHPVIVLPGFGTSDRHTVLLRRTLTHLGYEVHGWELGMNRDHQTVGENGERLAARIESIASASGQSVSLIGWSLGGVIAREAARRRHEGLRQVITLGSSCTGVPHATRLKGVYRALTGNALDSERVRQRYATGGASLPVPSTSIYSRSDGVVSWRNCVTDVSHHNENVEVISGHFGFVAHPAVLWAVADRLAQPEGQWRPFARTGPFGRFYPASEGAFSSP
jgi:hypothetical protein